MQALSQSNPKLVWLVGQLPMLVSALAVVLIAYSSATLVWQILAPPPTLDIGVVEDKAPLVQQKKQTPRYDLKIAKLHLFGKTSQRPIQDVRTAPKTRLNLTLRGVYATEADDAMAIIANGGANERFYHIGDSIPGGAILKAVYPDRVLLERNAKMETLPMPKGEGTGIDIKRDFSPSATAAVSPDAGHRLSRIRKQILKNPSQLGKMIQAKPVTENGRFKGYRLTPRGNSKLFDGFGLEAGDIVTAVNGISIDRPEKGLNALQKLVNAPEVTVTLLREGSEITIHHRLDR